MVARSHQRGRGKNTPRTVDEKQEDQFLSLIVYIREVRFRGPRFWIISVLTIIFMLSRLLGRRDSGMEQLFRDRVAIQQTYRLSGI